MEVFSLLKFWRNPAGESIAGDLDIRNRAPESDDETDDFFDLDFTGADCEFKQLQNRNSIVSSTTTKVHIDNANPKQNQTVVNKHKSPKLQAGETKSSSIRKILPIETHSKPQSPISLIKSPYKFRVFMFGIRDKTESSPSRIATSKRYTTEEVEIPVNAFLNRDNSLRSKMRCEIMEDSSPAYELGKKNTGVQKYIKLIRPFYVKASKIKIFDQSPTATPSSTASVCSPRKCVDEKSGGRAVVFRGAYKSLLKNRWTSSTVGAAPSPSPVSRRDDSVMQQQDGIQGAILHCKRSFSSSSCSSTRSQGITMFLEFEIY